MAMFRAKIGRDNIPSGRTIRRAEDKGSLPIARHRFGLAEFYSVEYKLLWPPETTKRRLKAVA